MYTADRVNIVDGAVVT